MGIELIQEFLLWCLLVNIGIYLVTVVAVLLMGDLYVRILKKVFRLDEETIRKATLAYIANYKLLITVFNFTPWLAIWIIQ